MELPKVELLFDLVLVTGVHAWSLGNLCDGQNRCLQSCINLHETRREHKGEEKTHAALYRCEQELATLWSRTMWYGGRFGFARHDRTLQRYMTLHADVRVLSRRYCNWCIAERA